MNTNLTVHRFGGRWTEEKLTILEKYLQFYPNALKNTKFNLIYIDAFAGTGRCKVKSKNNAEKEIPGSAAIALKINGYSKYHFIEKKPRHIKELDELVKTNPNGGRAIIHKGDADELLSQVLMMYSKSWYNTRGVLFLDPYGLQCTWKMVQQIAKTRALDVFFLVSLSGLYRQAAVNASGIDEGKSNRLTKFLGTDEWRNALYTNEQGSLFDAPIITRDPGYKEILDFTTNRLRTEFSHVVDPVLLRMDNGTPLFALYFAVSNASPAARKLAAKVSNQILKPLRGS